MLNLNDKKTKNYKILVALTACILNREYVVTNCTYITNNSIVKVSNGHQSQMADGF